ncbi:MAG TPA: hypothetical protein VJ440_01280, partial [Candidatus Brocadiaceae bacterium]|nr:hypothetical protein [Candidatus Brocadiaceae bacterium]
SGLFGLGRNKTKYLKSKRKTVKLFPIVFTGGGLSVVGLAHDSACHIPNSCLWDSRTGIQKKTEIRLHCSVFKGEF